MYVSVLSLWHTYFPPSTSCSHSWTHLDWLTTKCPTVVWSSKEQNHRFNVLYVCSYSDLNRVFWKFKECLLMQSYRFAYAVTRFLMSFQTCVTLKKVLKKTLFASIWWNMMTRHDGPEVVNLHKSNIKVTYVLYSKPPEGQTTLFEKQIATENKASGEFRVIKWWQNL